MKTEIPKTEAAAFKRDLEFIDEEIARLQDERRQIKEKYIDSCPLKPGDKVRLFRKINTSPGLTLADISSGKKQPAPKFEEVSKPAFVRKVVINSRNEIRIDYNKVKRDGTASKIQDYATSLITRIEIIEKSK